MKYNGVVLVGGKGTRLGELTKAIPKPLLKISNKNFLELLLYSICRYSFDNIYLICSYKQKKFVEKFHKKLIFGVKIHCLIEKTAKGTGGALYELKGKIKKNFFLINGDTFFNINYDQFYKKSISYNKKISMALIKYKKYKSNRKLSHLNLKKKIVHISQNKTFVMNGGIYFLKKFFLSSVKNKTASFENEYLHKLILLNQVHGEIFQNYFIDIGLKKNLKYAQKSLIENLNFKCAFLDRDGVINQDIGHLCSKDKLKFLPGVIEGIKLLNKKKYLVIIITNQAGIGKGIYSEKKFIKFSKYINKKLLNKGARIDDLYYCPHHPLAKIKKYKKKCKCRKPGNKMILNAKKNWGINLSKSFFIGDQKKDYLAAKKSSLKFYYNQNNFLQLIKKVLR